MKTVFLLSIILKVCFSGSKELKVSWTEEQVITQENLNSLESIKNNVAKEYTQEFFLSNYSNCQKHYNITRKLSLDDPKELIVYLDKVTCREFSNEELNECSPVTMNPYELGEALKTVENFTSNKLNKEYYQFDASQTQINFEDNHYVSDSIKNTDNQNHINEKRENNDVTSKIQSQGSLKKILCYYDHEEVKAKIFDFVSNKKYLYKHIHYVSKKTQLQKDPLKKINKSYKMVLNTFFILKTFLSE